MPMDAEHATPMPAAVGWLGYAGLLPFLGLALACWLGGDWAARAQQAQLGYGAVILSFVGALHWGLAMSAPGLDAGARNGLYAWSVVPSLLAWLALLLPATAGLWLLALGLVLHFGQDWRHARAAGVPGWYLLLRARLTAVATACVLLSALAPGAGAAA